MAIARSFPDMALAVGPFLLSDLKFPEQRELLPSKSLLRLLKGMVYLVNTGVKANESKVEVS